MTILEVNILPFLKNSQKNNNAGVIVKERAPDEKPADEIQPDTLEDCVERLLKAIESKDKSAMVEAIRDMHDELHLEMSEKSNSYDSQNEKAAQKE